MTFTGTTTGTECSPSATDAVKTSVATYMGSQTGVSQLEVSVVCINPDGSTVTARRLLQVSWLHTAPLVLGLKTAATHECTQFRGMFCTIIAVLMCYDLRAYK